MLNSAAHRTEEGVLKTSITLDEADQAIKSGKGLVWLDFIDPSEEEGTFLRDRLGFHPLAVQDCLSRHVHTPKVDDFDAYLFLIVHGIDYTTESEYVETTEMAIFIGANYVVTSHVLPIYAVDTVQTSLERSARAMRLGADMFAYTLIDTIVNNVHPTIDKMMEAADAIEEEAIHAPQQSTLEAILKLRRSALKLHRVMSPQRDLMNRLSRREFPEITEQALMYYRDVYDHIVRLEDLTMSLRDRSDNALATYMSSIANRQNETMRTLAIVAAIFLPLSLLAGIYGMNFEYMPELSFRWGYFAILGVMVTVAGGTFWYFWFRRWYTWGRHRVTRELLRVRPFAVEFEKLTGVDRVADFVLGHTRRSGNSGGFSDV